jgi:L-aminopeptidase/D-esterase-like protein
MGYAACADASPDPVPEGNVGAGTGASVGRILGPQRAMKGGVGSAAVSLDGGLTIGALVAVNAFGDVVDPSSGDILAGARKPQSDEPADTLAVLRGLGGVSAFASSTVIGVVASNAQLTKEEVNKVAQMAQDGIARAVRPAHTMFDGDTLFALATGDQPADVNVVGAFAAHVVAAAIVRGVEAAAGVGAIPAYRDLRAVP